MKRFIVPFILASMLGLGVLNNQPKPQFDKTQKVSILMGKSFSYFDMATLGALIKLKELNVVSTEPVVLVIGTNYGGYVSMLEDFLMVMETYKRPLIVKVLGGCYSACAILAVNATRLVAYKRAYFMFHRVHSSHFCMKGQKDKSRDCELKPISKYSIRYYWENKTYNELLARFISETTFDRDQLTFIFDKIGDMYLSARELQNAGYPLFVINKVDGELNSARALSNADEHDGEPELIPYEVR